MNHAELHRTLRALERDLLAPGRVHDATRDFLPAFRAEVSRLAGQAEDPDDAVYVIERAEVLLGDLGIE